MLSYKIKSITKFFYKFKGKINIVITMNYSSKIIHSIHRYKKLYILFLLENDRKRYKTKQKHCSSFYFLRTIMQ